MNLQQLDLTELLQALTLHSNHDYHDADLIQIIHKTLQHLEEYNEKIKHLVKDRVWTYIVPPWCSSLEKTMLWLGGCRPSSYIRLIYALFGLKIEAQLSDFLRGIGLGELGDLSSVQISLIDKLQRKTIQEETRVTSRMASLQEDMFDNPFADSAVKMRAPWVLSQEVVEAFRKNKVEMARFFDEAGRLRLRTIKEMVEILAPVQAVRFLVAEIKLCLCMNEWGKIFDTTE